MKASALLIIFVASAAAISLEKKPWYPANPEPLTRYLVRDQYVPIDDLKAKAAGLYKDGEEVSPVQLAAISKQFLSDIRVDEEGSVDPSQQNLVTGFYYKTDAALQLESSQTVTFEENLKQNSSNKQLVDVIEDKETGTALGVYLNTFKEAELVTSNTPKISINDSIGMQGYSFKPDPNSNGEKTKNLIKTIINVVKVVVKLLPKCFSICPPWRNRVCAYSPTYGYQTFKTNCVLKRDICRGSDFRYARNGKC